jgi:hypothetical protein
MIKYTPTNFVCLLCVICIISAWSSPAPQTLAIGTQPQLSVDAKGIARIAFGRNDSIFCATSTDQGRSFSSPKFVTHVPGMHLGMARGPQLASSARFSVITAMDKSGDIHWFQLNHSNGQWTRKGLVNDKKGTTPEGLMSIVADGQDNFYAVWLDTRLESNNNIFFASLVAAQEKWSKNKLVYRSPDGHVCECCKPNIAVNNKMVAVMFRNWLNGSRDMYLARSDNKGMDFEVASKLGTGTWPLKGCPMDGGGLVFEDEGLIQTSWQRNGVVYTCRPGHEERELAKGRGTGITKNTKTGQSIVSYQEGENTKLVKAANKQELLSEKGSYLKTGTLTNGKLLCVWELNKTIRFKTI